MLVRLYFTGTHTLVSFLEAVGEACCATKGGGLFEFQTPPPPPDPPKFSNPSFSNFEILGESVGAGDPGGCRRRGGTALTGRPHLILKPHLHSEWRQWQGWGEERRSTICCCRIGCTQGGRPVQIPDPNRVRKLLGVWRGGAGQVCGSGDLWCLCHGFPRREGMGSWIMLLVVPPAHTNIPLATTTQCCLFWRDFRPWLMLPLLVPRMVACRTGRMMKCRLCGPKRAVQPSSR